MAMRLPAWTALQRGSGELWRGLWRGLGAGLAYAVRLLALVVEAPAIAPWTDDPR